MKRIGMRWIMLFAISTVIIGCGDENSPPVIDRLIAPEQVNPGDSVELQVVAHDADGDVLSYVWEVKAGTLDANTGHTVRWTAPSNVLSTMVKVQVNDGINESVVKSKRVSINLPNSAPIIKEIVVPKRIPGGEDVQLQAVIHDEDGDTLTYHWQVGKGTLSSETTPITIWSTPIHEGSVPVTLTVSDGISEVTKLITVRIVFSLIVPGEQAAGIKLGDAFDKVKALYGEPSELVDNWFAYWEPPRGLSGYLNFDPVRSVRSIYIDWPNKAKTAAGNGIGSTHKRVVAEFGPAEAINALKGGGEYHSYWKKGIHFVYNADFKVIMIRIA